MKLEMIQVGTNIQLGDFIRRLRNSSNYRNYFIDNTFITDEMQKEYMSKYGKDYYICVNGYNQMIGFIGVVNNDLRLAIRLEYKRQGVGSFMLNFIKTKYPNFEVKVRKSNIASQKFFEKHNIKYTLVE